MFGFRTNDPKPITKHTQYHVLRIFNRTRSRLIMCQFENGVWTLPMVTFRAGVSPHKQMFSFLNTYFPGIGTIISIVSVANWVDVVPNPENPTAADEEITTFLYDVETEGRIEPVLYGGFSVVRWTVSEYIKSAEKINRPTLAVRNLMEKEDA